MPQLFIIILACSLLTLLLVTFCTAGTITIRTAEAIGLEFGRWEGPRDDGRVSFLEVLIRVALIHEAVLLAHLLVGLGEHELVEAGVEHFVQARTLLRHSQRCTIDGMLVHTGVQVGEFRAKAIPKITVPLIDSRRVVALVLIGHVGVDPDRVNGFIHQHREGYVVGIAQNEV